MGKAVRASDRGKIPTLAIGKDDGYVALLRTDTGAVRWAHREPHKLMALIHGDDVVIAAFGEEPRRTAKPMTVPMEGGTRQVLRPGFEFEPIEVVAYRTSDGAALWRKSDWYLAWRIRLEATSGVVLASTGHSAGEQRLYALDAHTGAMRWTRDYTEHQLDRRVGLGPFQWFIAARNGRVFIIVRAARFGGPNIQTLHVLDAATGNELWTRKLPVPGVKISRDGKTVIERTGRTGEQQTLTLLEAADGSPAGELQLPPASLYCGLSEDCIAYLATGTGPASGERMLSAMPVDGGAVRWQVRHFGVQSVIQQGDTLLYWRHLPRQKPGSRNDVMELCALDAQTGRRRWRWRTPENPLDLLFVLGRHLPEAMRSISDNVLSNIEQTLDRAIATNDASVVWWSARNELSSGLWRRPHAVEWLHTAEDEHAVYAATRIGIFAISMRTGLLRWHALPMTEVSFLAVAPTTVTHDAP